MTWQFADVRNMSAFASASFDIVIDKGANLILRIYSYRARWCRLRYGSSKYFTYFVLGTMDAVMCEQGDVWELEENIAAEVCRTHYLPSFHLPVSRSAKCAQNARGC